MPIDPVEVWYVLNNHLLLPFLLEYYAEILAVIIVVNTVHAVAYPIRRRH